MVADDIGHAGRGVAGRVHGRDLKATDFDVVSIVQQPVELAAVAGEFGACVEKLAKGVLHGGDVRADGQPAAQVLVQVRRCREVVGVHMCLQQPLHLQAELANAPDQPVGTGGAGTARLGVVVEHAVDHRALAGGAIPGQVAEGERGRVEEGFDLQA